MNLPPGQKPRDDFPRFGLPPYAERFPARPDDRSIAVSAPGGLAQVVDLTASPLPRARLTADLHCVTTWSHRGIEWGGIRLLDLYEQVVEPQLARGTTIAGAVVSAQDGYRTSLVIEDLLRDDVLLADEMNGEPLSIAHGAPVRLVVPSQYGYKNLKHLKKIEFHAKLPIIKRGVRAFLDHPRARVAKEERGRWIPGPLLRYVYRPFIGRTARTFETALARHREQTAGAASPGDHRRD